MQIGDGRGVLVEVISVDDLLPRFADELSEFVDLAARGLQREIETRSSSTDRSS